MQFAPKAGRPSASKRPGAFFQPVAHQGEKSALRPVEGHGRQNRKAGGAAPGAADGAEGFAQVEHRLDQDEIGPAFGQAFAPGRRSRLRIRPRNAFALGLEKLSRRPDIAGDESSGRTDGRRPARAAAAFSSRRRSDKPAAASLSGLAPERIGRDGVRAGVEIIAMDGLDGLRDDRH